MKGSKEQLINELREGYKNAQELIRFMDAKAGVAVTFSGMVFVHCMDKFFSSFPCISQSLLYSFYVLKLILLLIFIVTTVIVFLSAFSCITAKGPIKQTGLPRILFPIGNHTDFSLFLKDLENCGPQHEYEELSAQVFNVGQILAKKMKECRSAVNALIFQIIIWAAIMLIFWIDKNT